MCKKCEEENIKVSFTVTKQTINHELQCVFF